MVYYINKVYGYFLNFLSKIITLFIKPTNNRILISCSAGEHFNGNSKQLFKVLVEQNRDVYFISRSKSIYQELGSVYNNRIVFSYSIKALKVFVSSRIVFITHGVYDTYPFTPFRTNNIVINLWHGFPFKAIGAKMDRLSNDQINDFLEVYSKTDYMISSSETETEILCESFGLSKEQIIQTGYPRYDILLEPQNNLLGKLNLPQNKKTLLYAPTFRDATDLILFPFEDFNFNELNDFLIKEDILLLIRLHRNDRHKINGKIQFNERIVYLDQEMLEEVNEVLPSVDLLITDYSGIFMDYAVLKRPMIFIPYDIEEYTADRGMNINLIEEYPGDVVETFSQFKSTVKQSLMVDSTQNKLLDSFLSKFHQYEAGKATQNLVNFIDSL